MSLPITHSAISQFTALLLPGLASAALSLAPIGRYSTGTYSSGGNNPTACEIAAYDPNSKRAFVINGITNSVDVLDLANPTAPTKIAAIPVTGFNPNSVAIRNGVVAVALADGTNNGLVRFFNAAAATATLATGTPLTSQRVGSLPDMLTFTPDGTKLIVANEGEPSGYGGTNMDPVGSISIINVSFPALGQVNLGTASTAGFTSYIGQETALRTAGVRIFGPGANAAQDFEPEYIAISSDSTKAYVTLQENNAIATVDLVSGTVTQVTALGQKNHNTPGNGFDGSRVDGPNGGTGIHIVQRQVSSFYSPDAITRFEVGGVTYLFTANEGDYRDYAAVNGGTAFKEETTVGAVTLDPAVFGANAAILQGTTAAGVKNLTITNQNGQRNPDGTGDADFEEIIMVGSRSFSTWIVNPNGTVSLGYDSGDKLEQISAQLYSGNFNVTTSSNTSDNRSTSKGPEPEGVVTGMVGATPILFVGNERQSNILMFNITDPLNPQFISSISTRDYATTPGNNAGGDIGPEGLLFIPAAESPNGEPLLIVTFENSGTTTIFQVLGGQSIPEASSLFLAIGAALPLLRRRRNSF